MLRLTMNFIHPCQVETQMKRYLLHVKTFFFMILQTSQTQMKRYLLHVKTVFWVFVLWLSMFETQMKRFL